MKKIAALFIALSMVLSLAACGTAASNTAETTAAAGTEAAAEETSKEAPAELTKISVVLDWYPNAIHTFLYEAIDKGYFAEEGLEVELISPAESVDAINFVASGKAEIGLTYPIDIILSKEAGMPVKALASVAQSALDCMASLASNDITEDLSTLKGKKIGYAGTAISKAVVDTVTAKYGLTEADYELVDVGFDLITSLTTGSVDLVVGPFINDEIVTMEQNGYELNVYMEQDHGVPELYGLVMAVNTEDYEARTDIYNAFLRACEKGFADMKADEDAALQLIMADMNSDDNPLDETQQRKSYEILLPIMEPEGSAFLAQDEQIYDTIIKWMVETAQISEAFPASDVMLTPAYK